MVTERQIIALKYLILVSRGADDLMKKILYFLIDKSEGLTKEVCVTLIEQLGFSADEINDAAHTYSALVSGNCTTHLNEVMLAIGSGLCFSVHYGDFDPRRTEKPFSTAGMFAGYPAHMVSNKENLKEGMPMRYTFWLAKKHYSRDANLVQVCRKDIEDIDLNAPRNNLYSRLVPA